MKGTKCAAQENVRDMRDLGNLRDLGCLRLIFIFKALEARGIRWRTLGTCNFICLAPWVPNPFFFHFYFRFIGKILQNIFAVGIGDLHLCIHWFFLISLHGWVPSILSLKLFCLWVSYPPGGHHRGIFYLGISASNLRHR